MTEQTPKPQKQDADGMPSTEELEEPSTEKQPDEEPTSDAGGEPEPSHQAVGIGVIGGDLVEPQEPPADR